MINYHERFRKVIDFIGQHLDEELSLKNLSDMFYISEFHFHRLFTAFTGMSLMQFVKWLRLKRAARQLIVNKDLTIITIAMNAGFESHEVFTRAFKKACGLSPSQFRKGLGNSYWDNLPYSLPKNEDKIMQVNIRDIDKIRLGIIEHRGDPKEIPQSLNKLLSWAKTQSLELKKGEAFAIAYDDPKTTEPSKFRIDFGIKISENRKLQGDIIEKFLPQGRYAVSVHKGSRDKISNTVNFLYRDWVLKSGEELGNLPCIFCYLNFEHEVAETEQLTECWLLLK